MYEKYGGTVIFQQASPLEPVGAIHSHMEKLEREGNLKILNENYNKKFWKYYRREHPFEVPSEQVDFSQPWWSTINEESKR